jgi:hypothetical protein
MNNKFCKIPCRLSLVLHLSSINQAYYVENIIPVKIFKFKYLCYKSKENVFNSFSA